MIEAILKLADDNLRYAEALAGDIDETIMAHQPAEIKNHPAWTLGHLSIGQEFILQLLEAPRGVDESWIRLFSPGMPPTNDRQNFPPKADLLSTLHKQHERVKEAVEQSFEARAEAPNPIGPLAKRFPTVGDLVLYLMTTHEATHLGQLSAWRRAMNLPNVDPAVADDA